MGNVRVNSDLRIAGELTAPRVEGDLGVSTGVVNLDPILARFGESAYATEQTEMHLTADEAAARQGQAAAPSAFDALQMDVHADGAERSRRQGETICRRRARRSASAR